MKQIAIARVHDTCSMGKDLNKIWYPFEKCLFVFFWVRQVELEGSTKGKLTLLFYRILAKWNLWIGGWTNENRRPSFSTSHIAS
jgi:hypothetical protein